MSWPGAQPTEPAGTGAGPNWPGSASGSSWPGSSADSGWPEGPGSPQRTSEPGWGARTSPEQVANAKSGPTDSGETARNDTPARATRTPGAWLFVASLLVVVSAVVALVTASATVSVIGWFLGGPLAIGSVAMFLVADSRARQEAWYVASDALTWLRRAVVCLALVAVALNAWTIANAVARGAWT